MSLKAFHIFFIVASILLCLGLSVWGFRDFQTSGSVMNLGIAVIAFVTTGALFYYLLGVPKKIKGAP